MKTNGMISPQRNRGHRETNGTEKWRAGRDGMTFKVETPIPPSILD